MFNAEKITEKLIKWIKEQVGSCNIVIGISGGKDSTICGMLAKLAIGEDRVYGIMLPNGVQKDINDSKKVCELLGIDNYEINIGKVTEALVIEIFNGTCGFANKLGKRIKDHWDETKDLGDMYETNTPARIRMTTLYGVAAIIGNSRVINTCNGDEDYVGYSTKFGDSAGDFSPLADFTVEEVLQIGVVCAKKLGIYDELKDLIFKTPDDGMSGKSDEEKLGFTYKTIGEYRRTGICTDLRTKEKIDKMHKNNLHKLLPMPKFEYRGED